jgi:uncharacterized protein YjbJ (UPF0337 family)
MDQDRVEGSAKTIMGRVKSFVGGLSGTASSRLRARRTKLQGGSRTTVGGIKDTLREDHPARRP